MHKFRWALTEFIGVFVWGCQKCKEFQQNGDRCFVLLWVHLFFCSKLFSSTFLSSSSPSIRISNINENGMSFEQLIQFSHKLSFNFSVNLCIKHNLHFPPKQYKLNQKIRKYLHKFDIRLIFLANRIWKGSLFSFRKLF